MRFDADQHGFSLRLTCPSTPAAIRSRPCDALASTDEFLARGPDARSVAVASADGMPPGDWDQGRETVKSARQLLTDEPNLVAAPWTLSPLTAYQVEFWQADDPVVVNRMRAGSGTLNQSGIFFRQWLVGERSPDL